MAASNELHDLADDAVVQIMGWCCVCDRGFVAMAEDLPRTRASPLRDGPSAYLQI